MSEETAVIEESVPEPESGVVTQALAAPAIMPETVGPLAINVDTETATQIVKTLSTIVDEFKVTVRDGAFEIKAVDAAHCMLIRAHGAGLAEGSGIFGLDADKLASFLRNSKGQLQFTVDFESARIVLANRGVERRVSLVDHTHMREPNLPVLALTSTARIRQEAFLTVLKHIDAVSDHFEVKGRNQDLVIGGRGEVDAVERIFKPSDVNGELLSFTPPTSGPKMDRTEDRSLFSLDAMLNVVQTIPKECIIRFAFGTDYPIQFSWSTRGIEYVAMLAPRVESE